MYTDARTGWQQAHADGIQIAMQVLTAFGRKALSFFRERAELVPAVFLRASSLDETPFCQGRRHLPDGPDLQDEEIRKLADEQGAARLPQHCK